MDMNEFAREYFNFCNEVGLRPAQVVVSAGGALLMLGLRESSEDLDLDAPADTYELLRYKLGADKERATDLGTYLDYNEKVSLQKLPDGITVQTLAEGRGVLVSGFGFRVAKETKCGKCKQYTITLDERSEEDDRGDISL